MKKLVWTGIAFLFLISCGLFLNLEGLSQDAMWVVGIFGASLILWITQGIEWPSVFVLLILGLIPTLGFNSVLMSAFGNSVFGFLLFTFMSTYALGTTPIMKNIAYKTMDLNIARKGPRTLMTLLLGSVLLVGLFVSPTVLFFIVYPIFEEILNVLNVKKGSPFGAALMIGLVFIVSLSSGMTPIGHVFPVLAMSVYESIAGTAIDYAQYMTFAIPFGIILYGVIVFGLSRMFKFDAVDISHLPHHTTQPMEAKDKAIIAIFSVIVLLWIIPSIITTPWTVKLNSFGTAFPPLLGVSLMSMIHINKKPLLKITDALSKGVPWISLLMAGATLALGAALTHSDIGIINALQSSVGPMISHWPRLGFIAVFVIWALFQSSISSHMVTAQVVSAVAVPIALVSTQLDAKAIVMVIGLMASIGSSTPASMPYVAVIGSSGWTNPKEILKFGVVITIVIALLTIFIGYPFAEFIL
ncbi:hypothetical protein AOC36_02245 [Erysipelothrix larvae]|uniref:Sodium:sulfate symporter n=1 Tax=Erysipelothrix larvae TaxID=1514105 RepID=A0A0X8GYP2_9FIRM|nr:anion permease [Erysipelothrix larvae]AMC92846.1 hypothetical protein AOC36_02245 [Erysipelothrix larvae]